MLVGVSCRNGGLLIDGLVGIAASAEGIGPLYAHRESFSHKTCKDAALAVARLSDRVESYESMKARDRVWTQTTMGWHGGSKLFLFETTGSSLLIADDEFRDQFLAEQATMRLLAMELALRAYFLEHKTWPATRSSWCQRTYQACQGNPFDGANGYVRYRHSEMVISYTVLVAIGLTMAEKLRQELTAHFSGMLSPATCDLSDYFPTDSPNEEDEDSFQEPRFLD